MSFCTRAPSIYRDGRALLFVFYSLFRQTLCFLWSVYQKADENWGRGTLLVKLVTYGHRKSKGAIPQQNTEIPRDSLRYSVKGEIHHLIVMCLLRVLGLGLGSGEHLV